MKPKSPEQPPSTEEQERPEKAITPDDYRYGWEFHRLPLAVAVVLTAMFYLVVWLVFGG